METVLTLEELFYLLKDVEYECLPDAGEFVEQPANEEQNQSWLQAGQAAFNARKGKEQKLVGTLADPVALLDVRRLEDHQGQRLWFINTTEELFRLERVGAKQYKLAGTDESVVEEEILDMFPLQPVPAGIRYHVRLTYDDFVNLRDMATQWEEVPALEVLEADGLEKVASEELFDSVVEPQWRAIIACLEFEDGEAVAETQLRLAQGQEISWLARPSQTDDTILVETASEGLFELALEDVFELMF